jgi:diadenosine tetraphosphate (Ap4A) HIT family hydrolase
VTELHTLIIPKRHVPSFFDLFDPEKRAINQLLIEIRSEIEKKDTSVRGFNVGINNGESAGQTVDHAHVPSNPEAAWRCRGRTGRRQGHYSR